MIAKVKHHIIASIHYGKIDVEERKSKRKAQSLKLKG